MMNAIHGFLPVGKDSDPVVSLAIEIGGQLKTVRGRDSWTLSELGLRGVTPIERPAPRWSHYVDKLRGAGIFLNASMRGRLIGSKREITNRLTGETA